MNAGGVLLVVFGIWVLAQTLKGGLLTRLNIINSSGG